MRPALLFSQARGVHAQAQESPSMVKLSWVVRMDIKGVQMGHPVTELLSSRLLDVALSIRSRMLPSDATSKT
eukprot:5737729-Amphidinium_carterae.1